MPSFLSAYRLHLDWLLLRIHEEQYREQNCPNCWPLQPDDDCGVCDGFGIVELGGSG